MEARFIVVQKITKALCRGLAATQRKRFSVYFIFGLLLLILGGTLCVLGEADFGVLGLVLGCLFLLLGIFGTELSGLAAYNSMNPHVLADGARYAFFDDRFESSTSIEFSRMRYEAILQIVETDEAFYLYITKVSALSVEKAGFKVGSVDAFRAFLTEKTGLRVTRRRYKTCTKNKVIAVIAVVAVLASGLTAYGVRSAYLRRQPKVFSVGELSVTLTGGFTESRYEEDNWVYLYSEKGGIAVYLYDEPLPFSAGDGEPFCTDAEAYATYRYRQYREDDYYSGNAELFRRADGIYRLTHTYDNDDWICCEIIGQSGDCLWVAEFDYPAQSETTVRYFMDSVKIGGV